MERSASSPSRLEWLSLFLASLGALCLVLQLLLGWAAADSLWGGVIGWACTVVVGGLSSRPAQNSLRIVLIIGFNAVLPNILSWQSPMLATSWLIAGAISLSYIVPLMTWGMGIQPVEKKTAARSFRFTTRNRRQNHPVPGCLVTGILIFALPLPNPFTFLLATGYLLSLLSLTSLGALENRRREEATVIAVAPNFIGGWGSRIASLLTLALLAGIVGVAIVRLNPNRVFSHFIMGPGSGFPFQLTGSGEGGGTRGGVPNTEGSGATTGRRMDNFEGKKQEQAQASRRTPSLPALLPALSRLLPILLIGLALAYLLMRYGARLFRWLQRTCARFLLPLFRGYRAWQDGMAAKRRETMLRTIMGSLPDPFAPVTQEDTQDTLFQKWVEAAAFFGIVLREKDGIYDFAYRLERLDVFPASDIYLAAQVCSQSVYGLTRPILSVFLKRASSLHASNKGLWKKCLQIKSRNAVRSACANLRSPNLLQKKRGAWIPQKPRSWLD